MSEKIIGYILLCVGIVVIALSGYSVYAVFTKQAEPVKLFNFKGIGIDVNQVISNSLPPEIAQMVTKNQKPQSTEIISADILNETSNFVAHYILMGFIASLGFKIATLGTTLVRPVVVKLKENRITEVQSKPTPQ